MKKLFYVLIVVVVFLAGLPFIYSNSNIVTVKYSDLFEGEYRLAIVLLFAFVIGVLVGYLVSLVGSIKTRRKLYKANKTVKALESNLD